MPLLLLLAAALAAPTAVGLDTGVDFGPIEATGGCQAWMRVDVGADGEAEWVWRYTFDHVGRLTRVDGRTLFGGTGRPRMAYTYDESGRLALQTWDTDRDGVAERTFFYRYQDDELVERVEEVIERGIVGRVEYAWAQGRVVATWTEAYGVPAGRTVNQWDGDLLVSTRSFDELDRPAGVSLFTFDGFGRHVGTLADEGLDGMFDNEDVDVRAEDGRLLERRQDDNYDGVVDRLSELAWRCPSRPDKRGG